MLPAAAETIHATGFAKHNQTSCDPLWIYVRIPFLSSCSLNFSLGLVTSLSTVKMASEMLSVTAPAYTDPSRYELSKLPRPTLTTDTDVLIKVHAASINPVDVKKAAGAFKRAVKDE